MEEIFCEVSGSCTLTALMYQRRGTMHWMMAPHVAHIFSRRGEDVDSAARYIAQWHVVRPYETMAAHAQWNLTRKTSDIGSHLGQQMWLYVLILDSAHVRIHARLRFSEGKLRTFLEKERLAAYMLRMKAAAAEGHFNRAVHQTLVGSWRALAVSLLL